MIIHYGQFSDAHQPTTKVFGLVEETRVSEGNPKSKQRTHKLCTQSGGKNLTTNPGGVRQRGASSPTDTCSSDMCYANKD